MLRDRVSHQLGAQADAASGRASASLINQLEQQTIELQADNLRLQQTIEQLEGALRETNDTLEAARTMNRELMAEINRPVSSQRLAEQPPRPASPPRRLPPNRRSKTGE